MSKPETKVFPVENVYLNDVPHAPLITNAETAARLIRTGAFTDTKPRGVDMPDPVEFTAPPILDHYAPPGSQEPAKTTEPTEQVGSPDSSPGT